MSRPTEHSGPAPNTPGPAERSYPGTRSQTVAGQRLDEKLFGIATRPRGWHGHAAIAVPERIAPLPAERLFRGEAERTRVLELGAGWGEFLVEWVRRAPEHDYVAFEIKSDRVRATLRALPPETHVRVVPVNFHWFLEQILPPAAFDWIIVNFPDPWPKRRHWKHRLVQKDFPARMAGLLRPGGRIHLATDYGPYARRMLRVFRDSPLFVAEDLDAGSGTDARGTRGYIRTRPVDWPGTRFEAMMSAEGRRPYYQRWRLCTPSGPT